MVVSSSTIHVDQTALDADGDTFDGFNLKEALAIAKDGDSILIHDGTYRGQFVATKAVTIDALNGASGHVTLEAPDTVDLVKSDQDLLTNNGRWRMPVLDLKTSTPGSGTVTVKNLTVDGRYQAVIDAFNGNKDFIGIGIFDTNAVIDRVTVKRIAATPDAVTGELRGDSENFGIVAEGSSALSSAAQVTIRNSTVESYQKTGIIAWGPKLNVDIHDNTINSVGLLGLSVQNGMQIGSGGARTGTTGAIYNNTVNGLDSSNTIYGSAGIMLRQVGQGLTVTGNTLNSGGGTGPTPTTGSAGISLYEVANPVTISGNQLNGLTVGIFAEAPFGPLGQYDAAHVIQNNQFSTSSIAIYDSQDNVDPSLDKLAANPLTITLNTPATVNNGKGYLDFYLFGGNDRYTDTGAAATRIDAGAGDDVIVTGSGNDILIGGTGNDTLTGGAGSDVFQYAATGNGVDVITDFGAGDAIRVVDIRHGTGSISPGLGHNVSPFSMHVSEGPGNTTTLYIDTNGLTDAAELQITLLGIYKPGNFSFDGEYIRYVANPVTPVQPTEPTTPSTPVTPTQPTEPTTPTAETVDGVTVQTTTRTDANGNTTTTLTIPVVTAGRVENPSTPNGSLADIPLAKDASGNTLVLASLPVGVGLTSEASTGVSLTLRDKLIAASQPRTLPDDFAQVLQQGIDAYVPTVTDQSQVTVRTLTFSVTAGMSLSQAIAVKGASGTGEGDPLNPLRQEALVIDARALPAGSVLDLSRVEFAIVIGAVRVIGGEGRNFATGDGSAQWMVLGADDDILHGGAGDDTVGSLGGNDQVFGDAGNDIVFGGTGHDTLSGGSGNDRLDGGLGWDTALQSGSLADYTLRAEGQFLVLTNKATGEVDRLKSIETVQFDTGPSLYIADSDAEAALAHIATRWLGRAPTTEEGAWAQQNSQLSDVQVAQAVLRSSQGAALQGKSAEELVAGWKANAQIVRMDTAPERVQGTAHLDVQRMALNKADLNLARTGPDRWETTSLIDGSMSELVGIERLRLNDVSVALDMQGTAGKAAALLAVALGASALNDKSLAGQALAALDAGMGLGAVGEVALRYAQTQQSKQFTAQETVQWLWKNATGSEGTQAQLQPYVQQLQAGQVSAGDLVNAAVQHALANPSAQLVGVMDAGLLYSPVA
ncbi:hypothetical protein [Delftia sp. PS-11]|uniref:hypothetical protein n=1 Tax=Delftia sp. PS-11 TaxID=2767222 RepID=UPI003AB2E9BE